MPPLPEPRQPDPGNRQQIIKGTAAVPLMRVRLVTGRNAADTRDKLLEAVRRIHRDAGAVCDHYDICAHASCSASYTAWAWADSVLTDLGLQ